MQANESDLDNECFENLAARLKELHVITFFETMTRHNKVIHIKTIKTILHEMFENYPCNYQYFKQQKR